MRHGRLTVIALWLAPLTLGATAGTQSIPPFKSQTDLIEVDAVVTDRQGDPVGGLNRDDFTVEEDGHPVAVSTFAEVDADQATSLGDGRFIVLLLDGRAPRAASVARMLVDRMTPHDVMAILSLSGSAAKTTTDKAAALEQLEQVVRGARRVPSAAARRSARGDASLPADCIECAPSPLSPDSADASRVQVPGPRPPASLGPASGSVSPRALLETMTDVTKQLRTLHRRKTLVYIGNASWLELSSAKAMTGNAGLWFDAVGSAVRADVSVSVIDPYGPTGRPSDGANGFARETGGEAFVNRSDLQSVVDRIWRNAGHFYVLGYVPPSAKTGRHSIRVRVDRPDVDVRSRQQR